MADEHLLPGGVIFLHLILLQFTVVPALPFSSAQWMRDLPFSVSYPLLHPKASTNSLKYHIPLPLPSPTPPPSPQFTHCLRRTDSSSRHYSLWRPADPHGDLQLPHGGCSSSQGQCWSLLCGDCDSTHDNGMELRQGRARVDVRKRLGWHVGDTSVALHWLLRSPEFL